jgi:hypothetical protein
MLYPKLAVDELNFLLLLNNGIGLVNVVNLFAESSIYCSLTLATLKCNEYENGETREKSRI